MKKRIKKISSIFAALIGVSGGVARGTDAITVSPTEWNFKNGTSSKKINKIVRVLPNNLPIPGSKRGLFLSNFNKSHPRPSQNLEDGELVSRPHVPDFDGLEKCGVLRADAKEFYSAMVNVIKLKNSFDELDSSLDDVKFRVVKDQLVSAMTGVLDLVKVHASKYSYIEKSDEQLDQVQDSANHQGGIKDNGESRDEGGRKIVLKNLKNYSKTLNDSIEMCSRALVSSPNLSDVDRVEIADARENFKKNPAMDVLWYNNKSHIPLTTLVAELGEAKIISLYTRLLLTTLQNNNVDEKDYEWDESAFGVVASSFHDADRFPDFIENNFPVHSTQDKKLLTLIRFDDFFDRGNNDGITNALDDVLVENDAYF